MPRTYSSPMNIESSHVVLDRPMRLSEIQVASEHALKKTLSDPDLWTSLSSKQNFEVDIFYFLKLSISKFIKWKNRYIKFGNEQEVGVLSLSFSNLGITLHF